MLSRDKTFFILFLNSSFCGKRTLKHQTRSLTLSMATTPTAKIHKIISGRNKKHPDFTTKILAVKTMANRQVKNYFLDDARGRVLPEGDSAMTVTRDPWPITNTPCGSSLARIVTVLVSTEPKRAYKKKISQAL